MENNYTVKTAVGLKNLPECATLRLEIFVDEQKFTNEIDEIDETALHIAIYSEDELCAVGRTFFSDGYHKIGRICVSKKHRGKNLGEFLMLAVEKEIIKLGGKKIKLSAQCRVRGFYEKLGYKAVGEEYFDEYCPHIDMVKEIV